MKKLTLILFFFLILTSTTFAQMTLVFEVNSTDGMTAYLPFGGTVNVTVDWDDGTTETITSAGVVTHTYLAEGTYTVSLTGDLDHFGEAYIHASNRNNFKAVTSWGNLGMTDLSYAFQNADSLQSVPSDFPPSVVNASYMFNDASTFNQDISSWDVSGVTDMSSMFRYASAFNSEINGWNLSSITDMSSMFYHAKSFNKDITWTLPGSDRTDTGIAMIHIFNSASAFNQDISDWDVSGVTDMRSMFMYASAFNQDISSWDVSGVTDMSNMFRSTSAFNQDISDWDVSRVTDMSYMFALASAFNSEINGWNLPSITNMRYMFYSAESFNKDITWTLPGSDRTDTGIAMRNIFNSASAFNQDISDWDVSRVWEMNSMFYNVTLSTENYSNILISWANSTPLNGLTLHGGNSMYNSAGETARNTLVNTYGWTITDGGFDESSMPVELISFTASIAEDKVKLNWETATEVNNYGFDVECRIENGEWEKRGFVQGNGTTNSPKSYSFKDDFTLNPNHNLTRLDYRLKQIDNDGTFEYSKVVTVDLRNITSVEDEMNYEFSLEQNYPNPFNPTTTINFTVPNVGDAYYASPTNITLIVYDIMGREVATLVNEIKSPGNYEVPFDGSNLSSGMYFYKLTSGEFTQTRKLMLVK